MKIKCLVSLLCIAFAPIFAFEENHEDQFNIALEINSLEEKLSPLVNSQGARLYSTSHFGVFHHVQNVAPDGSWVQLEDDSIWEISGLNQRLVQNWLPSDLIVIAANSDTKEAFRLFNNTLLINVPCSLKSGPTPLGRLSHWIVAIDGGKITLEDGSIWAMSIFHHGNYKNWEVNDPVIVGTNLQTGLMFRLNPNILINANKKNYALGSCEYLKSF